MTNRPTLTALSATSAIVMMLFTSACGSDKTATSTVTCETPDPPGASPAPNPKTSTMYTKYGAGFVAVRDSIVTKALAAPTASIGTSFQTLAQSSSTKVETFKKNLADFLIKVYSGGTTDNYTGTSMQVAHANLKITGAQYDYFITSVVVPALTDNGVTDEEDLAAFAAPVTDPAFKASIVTCK